VTEQIGPASLDASRGAVIAGGEAGEYGPAARSFARQRGWPLLAEPTSGMRTSDDDDPAVVHYDLLLRSEAFAAERPDVVLRVGEMPTSKPLRAWLEGCRQVVVDPHLDWHDPTRSAEALWAAAPDDLVGSAPDETQADPAWLERWLVADAIVAEELAATAEPFEPLAYNVLADSAEIIWVSSSLPIRDVESYFPRTQRTVRILANRGANGIDGVVSSAAGAAIASGGPVHLVIGELALLHDVGGLVTARRAGAQLAILCVNNGGGAIFDFLPVAEQADSDAYEGHIATPVPFDLGAAAALGGLTHHVVQDAGAVRDLLKPGALVELRVDRSESLARHRELAARIVARVDAL
jgi:2-succinyl-5-enolpyruvyl-6-hydroxy-3-cyclohexene-1-carboxylate synthase